MHLLNNLTLWFQGFAESDWAIIVLVLGAFSESIFFPIPPDPLLIPMGVLHPESALWYAALVTVASVLGAIVAHWLGKSFGRPLLERFVSEKKIQIAEAFFNRYGAWTILVAAVTPVPYKVVTILAGVLELDIKRFILVSIIGRSMRFISLGVLLFLFGDEIRNFLEANFQKLTLIMGIALIVFFFCIWAFVRLRRTLGKSVRT